MGDFAPNPFFSKPTFEELEFKNQLKKKNSTYLPSSPEDQWRTTCNIKFQERKLPDTKPPRLNLKPYYIFGYREKDGHNNIKYIDNDNILYSAGKIGIIQNLTTNVQKYYVRHINEIRYLCINYSKTMIASGEVYFSMEDSNTTYIRIWSSKTLEELSEINIPYNGISALSFSLDDKYLVCCCLDEKHKIALIDLSKNSCIYQEDGDNTIVLNIAFKSNNEFATVGISHYKFWIINDGKLLCKEYIDTLKDFVCKLLVVSVMGDNFVTGNIEGYITLWKGQVNLKNEKCHNAPIDSLYSDNKLIISGGRDKKLTILNPDLTIIKSINLSFEQIIDCSPKSIDILADESGAKGIQKILLGTLSGDILELIFETNILDDNSPKIKIYNYSHFTPQINSFNNESNEITSISYLKKLNMFVTTCEDKTIRFWDLENKKQINYIQTEIEDYTPTSSTFSYKEDYLLVGFSAGIIRFYSIPNFNEDKSKEIKVSNFPITVIKYYKDDNKLACATKDVKGNAVIDIFINNNKDKYCSIVGAQNEIDGLDWSDDGNYIVSFSHNRECRIFSLIDKKMISDYSEVDYKEWLTWTIGYGWPLKGYYNSKEDNAPIIACEKFKLNDEDTNYVIAIGDYNGCVKLYKYPIADKSQKYISNIIEHGNKVSNVRFGRIGNKNILLTSGGDECLIAWEIEQI